MPAIDPSHGSGMSQTQGQTRVHHRVLDPLLIATRGTQEVSGIVEGSKVMESHGIVERCRSPEANEMVERRK